MTFRDDNGRELELNGDFAMNKQSVSIFSGSIKGDVSITFQVDNNSVNRAILNYTGPQMINQVAFTRQPFNRVRNGNILDRGYIVIQSEEEANLSCFYVSGNSNWLQLLEGLITELDFSGETNGKNYNKKYSRLSILQSTEGITYPFIDWCFAKKKGNNLYSLAIDVDDTWVDMENDTLRPLIQFYPCFYVHSLVNEIISQAGLKKDGNLFSDGLYKSLALPPISGELKRDPFKKVLLNGSSQTYSAGVGVYEKITGLTLRQADPETWDDNLKRFIDPIQSTLYVSFTMTAGTANRVRVLKNGLSVSTVTIVLGIKQRIVLEDISPGDYFELYTTRTTASPFSASFDIEYEIPEVILFDDYIDPGIFLPDLQSIDVIKFLINFFGCSVYFDSTSKSLTITIIERMKLEDAYDWSEFYISHRSDYTDNAGHNFINWSKSSDSEITKYNQSHTLKFADGDLQTKNTLLEQKQIAQFPFAPSTASFGFNGVYALNIPLINLIDEGEPILFTAIASTAGLPFMSRFTTGLQSILHPYEVVRITNGNGVNIGYYMTAVVGGATYEDIYFEFESTDTGKIWRQKINYQKIEPRIVSVKPSSDTEYSQETIYDFLPPVTAPFFSEFDYATFSKNYTGLMIDRWKNNLAIDNPVNGTFTDPTIKELYFNKISKFLKNPPIRMIMRLPEAEYQRYKFDQFIYLKTEKLTGYFFVNIIGNYVDGNTPVEIQFYML